MNSRGKANTEHGLRIAFACVERKVEQLADQFERASRLPSRASYQTAMKQARMEMHSLLIQIGRNTG